MKIKFNALAKSVFVFLLTLPKAAFAIPDITVDSNISNIAITGSDTIGNIIVESGYVASDTTDAISLKGGGGTTLITNYDLIETLTTTDKSAITSVTNNNSDLTIENYSVIQNDSNGTAPIINLTDSNGGSSFTINNSGYIGETAGANAVTAINVTGSSNTVVIDNTISGVIIGAINTNGNTARINNQSPDPFAGITGGIYGNITATTGALTITNNAGIIIGNIDLGTNNSSTLTTYAGSSIIGNLTFGGTSSAQIFTVNGGTFDGDIISNGGSTNIIINNNTTLAGKIGSSDHLVNALNIRANEALTLGSGDVHLEGISLNGSNSTLNLGSGNLYAESFLSNANDIVNFGNNNNSVITTSSTEFDTSTLNLGSGTHNFSGGAIAITDSTIGVAIASPSQAGSLTTSNAVSTDSNTQLNITISPSLYIGKTTSYNIIAAGTGSSINAVTTDKIEVNGVSTNKIGFVTFTTSAADNNLVLNGLVDSSSYVPSSTSGQQVLTSLTNLNNPTGELATISNYLIASDNVSNSSRDKVIESISTNNTGLNQATLSSVMGVISTIETRTENDIHSQISDGDFFTKVNDEKYVLASAQGKTAIDGSYYNDTENSTSEKNVWYSIMLKKNVEDKKVHNEKTTIDKTSSKSTTAKTKDKTTENKITKSCSNVLVKKKNRKGKIIFVNQKKCVTTKPVADKAPQVDKTPQKEIPNKKIIITEDNFSAENEIENSKETKITKTVKPAEVRTYNDVNIAPNKHYGTWAQLLGSSAKQENKDGFNGYNSKTSGVSFGLDTKIDKSTIVGMGLGISNTNIYASSNTKKTTLASYQLNFYGSKNLNGYFIDTFLAAALNQYNSRRAVPLIGETATSNYSGETYSGKIKLSTIKKVVGKVEFLPEIGILYAYNSLGSYSENGAGTLDLHVKGSNANLLEGTIGGALRYNAFEVGESKIFPKIKFTYGYDFIGNKQTSTANFVGQTTSFDTQSSKINRAVMRFESGVDIYGKNSVTVSANYMLQKKYTYTSHFGSLRVRYEF